MAKSSGVVTTISLNGQDLLGTGKGLYLDCSCTPAGFYTPGSSSPIVTALSGDDSSGVAWGGFVLQDTYPPTGQLFQQFWFLRDGETGLHSFSRAAYHNTTVRILTYMPMYQLSARSFGPYICRHLSFAILQNSGHCSVQLPRYGHIFLRTRDTGLLSLRQKLLPMRSLCRMQRKFA